MIFVTPSRTKQSETFIKRQIELLKPDYIYSDGRIPTKINELTIKHYGLGFLRRARIRFFVNSINKLPTDTILIQYGTTPRLWIDKIASKHKIVVHFHGYDATRKSGLTQEEYNKIFTRSDKIITPSLAIKNDLVDLGCDKNKIFVLPCVPKSDFWNSRKIRKLNSDDVLKLLFVGRLVEKKGVSFLLGAIREVVDAGYDKLRLTIIGDGPDYDKAKKEIERLDLEKLVQLLGNQSNEVVNQEMIKTHLLVQHSIVASDGDKEGAPVSLMEAISNGLPVVSTKHSGIPEIIEHGYSGLLSDEKNTKEMAHNIIKFLEDAELVELFSMNAIDVAGRLFQEKDYAVGLKVVLDFE